MLPEAIGVRIERFRNARGWSQEVLAAKMQTLGHSTVYGPRIHQMEHGQRVVRPDELVSLARLFGIPISELLGVPDYAPPE